MVAGCGNNCIKFIFFAFNFLIFALGATMLGLGLWIRFDTNMQEQISALLMKGSVSVELDKVYVALYMMAAIGGLLCLTGFLGCCGACWESVCLIGLFFTIIMVLFIAEIGCAVYIYVKKDELKGQFASLAKTQFVDNYDLNEDIKNSVDVYQQKNGCCGATGCQDYQNRTNGPPESCKCQESAKIGCSDQLYDRLKDNFVYVIVTAAVILLVELVAMVFSCVLCHAIRGSGYDYY